MRSKSSNELGEDLRIGSADIHELLCGLRQRPTTGVRAAINPVCSRFVNESLPLNGTHLSSGHTAPTHISRPRRSAQRMPQARTGAKRTEETAASGTRQQVANHSMDLTTAQKGTVTGSVQVGQCSDMGSVLPGIFCILAIWRVHSVIYAAV